MDNFELDAAVREYLQAKRTLSFHERRDHSLSIEQYRTMRENIERTKARLEAALDAYWAAKESNR